MTELYFTQNAYEKAGDILLKGWEAPQVIAWHLPEDDNTVTHVYFAQGTVQDTKGVAWEITGSPTIAPASGNMYAYLTGTSDTSYIRTTAVSGDAGDYDTSAGECFSVYALVRQGVTNTGAPGKSIVSDYYAASGSEGSKGWFHLEFTGDTRMFSSGQAFILSSTLLRTQGLMYLHMFGISGSTTLSGSSIYYQLNTAFTATTGLSAWPPALDQPLVIGTRPDSTGTAYTGEIHEVMITRTVPSSASFAAVYTAVSTSLAARGIALG
jgi:hypothetical protein